MTRVTFKEVAVRGTRRWVDADGKKRSKTRKFAQTVSPFNSVNGVPKTEATLLFEVTAQRDAWVKESP